MFGLGHGLSRVCDHMHQQGVQNDVERENGTLPEQAVWRSAADPRPWLVWVFTGSPAGAAEQLSCFAWQGLGPSARLATAAAALRVVCPQCMAAGVCAAGGPELALLPLPVAGACVGGV